MDAYSSGEELIIKTRKPYTITKQRERWTEEEHNRFLEALKLYGRAWQRIEEHIGTKTAVQIRSHAQKFFSKLEKEALAKGVPTGQSLDIEIPPSRPKRKQSNPYPRKTSDATLVQMKVKDGKSETPVSSLRCKQVLDLEKEPFPERPNEDEKSSNLKDNQDDSCSEVFTLPHEANCSSVSLVNKTSVATSAAIRNSCTFREFVPSLKEVVNHDKHEHHPMSFLNFENFMRLINLMPYKQLIMRQVSLQTWRILALHMRNKLKAREKRIWIVLYVQMRCKPLKITLNMLLCMS